MDSLLASYASSDDEEEHEQHHEISTKPISESDETSAIFAKTSQNSRALSSLPQPKYSSSAFPSLPPPKSSSAAFPSLLPPKSSGSASPSLPQPKASVFSSLPPPNSSSKFSSLPPPISDNPQPLANTQSSDLKSKKIVQFRPPPMLRPPVDEDDDDEEEQKRRKPIKEPTSSSQTSSLSSFFSSLPAPKNTLGSGSAPALGAGRRSVVETKAPTSNHDENTFVNEGVSINESRENYAGNWGDGSSSISTSESLATGSDPANWIPSNENSGSYAYYDGNRNYGDYDVNFGNYNGVSTTASATLAPETSGWIETVSKMPGKRGRNEIPADIVEVKQDELMKNRPREDQVKLTGIAFGPSYQPVSTKGKPSKLHKRKHQIGSLYFDMKQKESELAERRSKGFLTKAETQAKYGW